MHRRSGNGFHFLFLQPALGSHTNGFGQGGRPPPGKRQSISGDLRSWVFRARFDARIPVAKAESYLPRVISALLKNQPNPKRGSPHPPPIRNHSPVFQLASSIRYSRLYNCYSPFSNRPILISTQSVDSWCKAILFIKIDKKLP
jgi:hypothetical protein